MDKIPQVCYVVLSGNGSNIGVTTLYENYSIAKAAAKDITMKLNESAYVCKVVPMAVYNPSYVEKTLHAETVS